MDYMASNDRFYQLELRHRPALHGDIGSLLKIEGLVVGGEGAQAVLLLPSFSFGEKLSKNVFQLSEEEWSDFLQRSDTPELLMPGKAFHRKVRYEISGAVQQKVWVADGCKCMFCGAKMGQTLMTIDHWQPLELGGKNDTSNYLSCCKRENKDKGSMDPHDWCKLKGLDYDFFVEYLRTRKLP
jgi:hypothetical protein